MENQWDLCKVGVNKLPADFENTVKKANATKPEIVTTLIKDNGRIVYVKMKPIANYDVELCVHFHKSQGVTLAHYYAWDQKEANVFIRDLLDLNHELDMV